MEEPESARTFGMWLAIRDHLPVEIGQQFQEIVILQQNWAIRAYGERKLVT
jgi:hypothetical protein